MKKTIILLSALLAMQWQCLTMAGNTGDNLALKLRFGYNIGGTAPLGMPASIRSLDKFCLTPSFMAGADAWLPVKNDFGITAGLRVENKGLNAEITTKMYHMEVKRGESMLEGMYTGRVRQRVREWMITIPVEATYNLGDKVMLKAGPYMSVLLDKSFEGYVYDGYLRQGDPTGPKVTMGSKDDERATYDFSDDMRSLHFGIAAGVDWQIGQRIGVSADLNWGLNGIFRKDFKTVEQTLYPIYGTIGVFYRIR